MAAIRVAVVGAGAAGLVAAKLLSERSDLFSVVVFEQTGHIGGTWVYVEQVGKDERGLPVHSSMYANLRTNLPKEIMSFPSFPFAPSLPSFPSHEDVLHYLDEYAEAFQLRQYVKLLHVVESISPRRDPTGCFLDWTVRVRDHSTGTSLVASYDVVLICTGHYAEPRVSLLEGLSSFVGEVFHSHHYRRPDAFAGKRVAILGAGSSGQDIALDVAKVASKVYLCHDQPRLTSCDIPDNVVQKTGVSHCRRNTLVFQDGSEHDVDCFVFATGYEYVFPFLDETCHVRVADRRVTPLFQHVVNIEHPTMFFIGLPFPVCPFLLFHQQMLFVRSLLSGEVQLPSREDMLADEERDYEWRRQRGASKREAHKMDGLQFNYMDSLAHRGGFKPLPRVIESIWNDVYCRRCHLLVRYRHDQYSIVDEQTHTRHEGHHPALHNTDY